MGEVSINIGLFRSNISHLRDSLSGLDSTIKTSRTFDKTNISPFTDDLENIIKATELIGKYKTLLDEDIKTLESVGEQMRERDEEIANSNQSVSSNPNGPEAIR